MIYKYVKAILNKYDIDNHANSKNNISITVALIVTILLFLLFNTGFYKILSNIIGIENAIKFTLSMDAISFALTQLPRGQNE